MRERPDGFDRPSFNHFISYTFFNSITESVIY